MNSRVKQFKAGAQEAHSAEGRHLAIKGLVFEPNPRRRAVLKIAPKVAIVFDEHKLDEPISTREIK